MTVTAAAATGAMVKHKMTSTPDHMRFEAVHHTIIWCLLQHDTEGSRQVMQSTWSDSILPLAAFTSSKGPSTALNSSRQACAAAASEKDCTVSSASKTSNQQLKGKVQSSMFAFEAANVLLAIASWKLVKAGTIVMSQTGADSAACMEAYQLYCQAAGQLDEIRRKLLPILNTGSTGDLHRGLLSALHFFALGEAQVCCCCCMHTSVVSPTWPLVTSACLCTCQAV